MASSNESKTAGLDTEPDKDTVQYFADARAKALLEALSKINPDGDDSIRESDSIEK